MPAAVEDSEGAAAVEVAVEAVEEGAAARAIRVRTGLRVEGRWMNRIFRRVGLCSCLQRVRRWRAEVRMMTLTRAVGEDAAARRDLSLA
jgi:hypothetical protein